MSIPEFITAVAIHLLVPLAGIGVFLLLCRRMSQANIQSPPYVSWFVLFGVFGAWLLVLLTALFWKWSGMATIGVFALVFVAPLATAGVALSLRARKGLSRFHHSAFVAALVYSGVMLLVITWVAVQLAR